MNVHYSPDWNNLPLSSLIEAFASFRDEHLELLNRCVINGDTQMDSVRHLVIAALRRSSALVEGFLLLVENENRFAAIPIIRLQVDSAMRIRACGLVEDPVDFVKYLLEGNEPRKYKQNPKVELTDKAHHEALTQDYPYTTDVYQDTNGYVHLSDHHLFGVLDRERLTIEDVTFADHGILPPWNKDDIKGAVISMLWATHVLTEECKKVLKKYCCLK